MSTDESRDGLWLYNLILHYPLGPHDYNRKANEEGYYFKDGILGELLALMSVFFRCRLYFISSRLRPGNPSLGMTIKREYPFLRVRCNPGIHPPLFQNPDKNLAVGFKEFMDRVQRLDQEFHQGFILACHHYARAVKEVGVDAEMLFIRLVSAIETLSKDIPLDQRDDKLEIQGVANLIEQSTLSKELKKRTEDQFRCQKIAEEIHPLHRTALRRIFQRRKFQSQASEDQAHEPQQGTGCHLHSQVEISPRRRAYVLSQPLKVARNGIPTLQLA